MLAARDGTLHFVSEVVILDQESVLTNLKQNKKHISLFIYRFVKRTGFKSILCQMKCVIV